MSILRFVHAADLHLDSPFTGLREIAPEISATLHRATFAAYENIISLCIEEKVDALLVAGDIFDSADRSLKAQLAFVDGLKRLDAVGIRSFICHGNHDPLDGWEARVDLPLSCHRFSALGETVPVFPGDPQRAVVHGVSYPQREVRESLIPRFGSVEPGPFHIGLLHANVGNNTQHDTYAPCSLSDLQSAGMDYWALGHVHTREVLISGSPTVIYPGNPQGRHPNEPGARGVYLVDVNEGKEVNAEFIPVDVVRWDAIRLDIGGLQTEQQLLNAIDESMAERQAASEGRSLLVRLALAGRGELHQTLSRPRFLADLLESINNNWAQHHPFVWCERIVDSTSPLFDREQRRQGVDFLSDLLRLYDEARTDQGVMAEMRQLLGGIYEQGRPSPFLKGNAPSDDELRDMLTAAEALCLAELLEQEGE